MQQPKSRSQAKRNVPKKVAGVGNPHHLASAAHVEQSGRRQRGTTLHHQIALIISDRIMSGVYQPGEVLPAETEMCGLFKTSRITIRTALATLEQQGLVIRKQGIGTFVNEQQPLSILRAPMSEVVAHIEEIGHRTQVELLEFGLQRPPNHVRAFFDSPPEQALHRAVRLRFYNGRPFIHVETYVPAWIGNKIRKEQLERRPFYEVLQKIGVEFSSGEQTVSATLASPVVAARLGTDVSSALVRVRRFHRDAGGRPVQYIEFLSSPSVFELRMKLDSDDLPKKPR